MSNDKLYEAVERQYDRRPGWQRQLIGTLAVLAALGAGVVVVVALL